MSDSVELIDEFFKIHGHIETNLPEPHQAGYYHSESNQPLEGRACCLWDVVHGSQPIHENWVSSAAGHLEVRADKHSFDMEGPTTARAETRFRFKPLGDRIVLDFAGEASMHIWENYVQFDLQDSTGAVIRHQKWPLDDPVGDQTFSESNVVYDGLTAGQEYCIILRAQVSFGDQSDGCVCLKVIFSDDSSDTGASNP